MSLTPVTFSLTSSAVAKLQAKDAESENPTGQYDSLAAEGVEGTVNYDFCASGAEADQVFGEPVATAQRIFAMSHGIAAKGRAALAEGLTGKKLQALFYNEDKNERTWMPGVSAVRKTRAQKLATSIEKLSPEEQKREIESLQEALKARLAALK